MLLDTSSTLELFPNKTDDEIESDAIFVKKIEGMLAIAHHDQEEVARQFIDIGRMLAERKEAGKKDGSIPHGQWVPWLEQNFPSVDGKDRVRRLQQYKQVAEYVDSNEDAKTKVSSLLPQGFDAVLNEVRRIQAEEKKPPKPDPLTEDVEDEQLRILVGDCRERMQELDEKSVHCCICSPPYFGLRSYLSNFDYVDRPKGNDVRRWVNTNEKSVWGGDKNCEHEWTTSQRPGMAGMSSRERVRGTHGFDASEHSLCQKCGAWYGALGLEPTPELYVEHICEVFDEAWRVIRDDGTLWLVIGDSYNTKNLLLIPARVALALQARGWILRSDIIWRKNGTPESVTDRPTKSHEHVFLFAKQENYYYDGEAIKEPAVSIDDPRKGNRTTYNGKFGNKAFAVVSPDNKRNCRDVWKIPIEPFAGEHFAPFPKALIKPMMMAGCPKGGTVLDTFGGSGTTGVVSLALGRRATLIEANAEYAAMAKARIDKELPSYTVKANSTDAWGNAIVKEDTATANEMAQFDGAQIIRLDDAMIERARKHWVSSASVHLWKRG